MNPDSDSFSVLHRRGDFDAHRSPCQIPERMVGSAETQSQIELTVRSVVDMQRE